MVGKEDKITPIAAARRCMKTSGFEIEDHSTCSHVSNLENPAAIQFSTGKVFRVGE
jgi:hypothetical protein